MKRVRFDDEEPPVAGPSRLPGSNPDPTTPTIELADLGTGDARAATGLFVEPFPISTAGAPIGTQHKKDQDLREYLELCGRLGERNLFETAEILMTTGLSGRGRTRHLKGPMYNGKGKGVWKNNEELLRDVDKLPKGPTWTTAEVTVGKDEYARTHTIYLHDILEVIRQLIGARRFKRWMRYAPERHWTSRDQKCRVYDEMWSGDWWWRMQYLIRNENGTVVPLIVATDETTLTNNPNSPKAHPVYLSIGNISKSIRRKPTKRAMVVVGYLPVDSFEDVANKETRRRYRGELLHQSLAKIFEPLKTASEDGVLAWCADSYLCHIYPIMAAWLADWPEQNDVACTTQSGCPRCMHPRKGRGQGGPMAQARDQDEMLKAFQAYEKHGRSRVLEPQNLTPWSPFWADMPHFDIASCLAPDLLHQLYKGMFEHARNWAEKLLGTKELNRRFKSMPFAQDLRWFKKGVTTVKVWAGRESREMMRQFLPVVIDVQAPANFVVLIRALLDFAYVAHGAQLTDIELAEMDKALATFHRVKRVLVDEKIMPKLGLFDRIAKLHMLGHWTGDIRELGTPDGFSTETPEHLHIVYVKIPWRVSSRRNPMPQIVKYVQRLEAVQIQRAYVEEFYGEDPGFDLEDFERHANDDDDESEDERSVAEDEGSIAGDERSVEGDSDNEADQVEVGSESVLEPEQGESEIHYP
ncbi:hypothetical protein FRC07_009132 [Ceratobasidium sp. 392]|nr:hypothetical protein FRC07_009132 [Ceratobasidium sp. 392]